jgi:D-glycero-D-manno-heptose 1,7-bisphosphate phosphatase
VRTAIFIDRDGVVNRKAPEGKYITCWKEVEFLPGVFDAVRRLNRAGYLVILITNQRAVAKNKLSEAKLREIHEKMLKAFEAKGALINAVYYCPHEIEVHCACRKPKPGMLLRAAKEHSVDLAASWMLGDSVSDVLAGKAAGCRTVWLTRVKRSALRAPVPSLTAGSLAEAVTRILKLCASPI